MCSRRRASENVLWIAPEFDPTLGDEDAYLLEASLAFDSSDPLIKRCKTTCSAVQFKRPSIRNTSMAKSYSQIQTQIKKLQAEAEAVRAKEVAGVVAKIRQAIDHYGLTAHDLGLNGRAPKAAEPATRAAIPATKKFRRSAAAKRPAGVIKCRDDAGHTWTGHGKRPNWFLAALGSGKSADELLV